MDPTITKREAVIKVGNITSPGTVMFDYDNWGTDGAKERATRYCESNLYPKLKALLDQIPLREGRHQALMNFITYMAALTWPDTQIYIYSERDAHIWLAPWFHVGDRAVENKIDSIIHSFFKNRK